MKTFFALNCWLYDRILSLYDENLLFRHGDEMRGLFRQQLADALRHNPADLATLWSNVATDTLTLVGPTYLTRLRLLSVSALAASALVACFLVAFGSFHTTLVHASTDAEPLSLASPDSPPNTARVPLGFGKSHTNP
jgi:hypothetical protein